MPIFTIKGQMYRIPAAELEKFKLAPGDIDENELVDGELDQVSGGVGSEPTRLRTSRASVDPTDYQWYGGD